MKTLLKTIAAVVLAVSAISCDKDTVDSHLSAETYNATTTFKPYPDGTYYVWVDEDTALIPVNSDNLRFPWTPLKEKRALISYRLSDKKVDAVPGFKETQAVFVTSIDTIRTKNPIVYDKAKEAEYGNDPLALYIGANVFPGTLIEDGYLSVVFDMPYLADFGPLHEINLLTGVNPDDPYEVHLRHNAHKNIGPYVAAHICDFRLKDLPPTNGKEVVLTLKWYSMVSGKVESAQFKYRSREDW